MGKKSSWVCTLATQFSLCLALYVFLNMGHPQHTSFRTRSVKDVYFISVTGGFRPLDQQTLLLKQVNLIIVTLFIGTFFFGKKLCELYTCILNFVGGFGWFFFFVEGIGKLVLSFWVAIGYCCLFVSKTTHCYIGGGRLMLFMFSL